MSVNDVFEFWCSYSSAFPVLNDLIALIRKISEQVLEIRWYCNFAPF